MGPHGKENFKMLLLLQLRFIFSQTFSGCFLTKQSSQKLNIGILKFQIYFIKKIQIYHCEWESEKLPISWKYRMWL